MVKPRLRRYQGTLRGKGKELLIFLRDTSGCFVFFHLGGNTAVKKGDLRYIGYPPPKKGYKIDQNRSYAFFQARK